MTCNRVQDYSSSLYMVWNVNIIQGNAVNFAVNILFLGYSKWRVRRKREKGQIPALSLYAKKFIFCFKKVTLFRNLSRLLWKRRPRYELSSSSQTLGSWVRFPLEARMWSTFIPCCPVQVTALRLADPMFSGSCRLATRLRKCKTETKAYHGLYSVHRLLLFIICVIFSVMLDNV
jgi:hypothetical protein